MRSLMMGFAAFTLIFTSCQQDESVDSGSSSNPDVINFSSTTTRASISDLGTLVGDANGFQVYAKNPASSSAWYPGIDGTAKYRYTSGNWGWTSGAPQWPTTLGGYPMDFYAYYPATATGFTPANTPVSVLLGSISVQASPAAQVDYLAATATALTKPLDGKLTMVFNHIMSKINFGVIAGLGTTVNVQSLIASNLKNAATFDYLTGTWGTPTGSDTYVYYGSYYPSGTGGTSVIPTFTPAIANDVIPNPFYTLPHNKHLMLMPQTTPTWNKTSPVANAYIGLIYRMSTLTNPNAVGYASASSHPGFVIGSTYTGPLFVKVGFPFAPSSLTWDKGNGYRYDLLLGTLAASNGYYVDTYYYDENGNRTTYQVPGKSVGDPVLDGTINFNVTVTPWVDLLDIPVN